MTITDPTISGIPPIANWTEIRRFSETLHAIDPSAVPADSLARGLHLAVATLDNTVTKAPSPSPEELAEGLSGMYSALSALDETSLGDATPRELMELIVRVDDAKALLETSDLSVVGTDALAAWFRQLYCGIIRLRVASRRLHQAWAATGVIA
jgi:hypothetical protein